MASFYFALRSSFAREGVISMRIRLFLKRFLFAAAVAAVFIVPGVWLFFTWEKIPSSIRVTQGQQVLSLDVPVRGEIYLEQKSNETQQLVETISEADVQPAMSGQVLQVDLSQPLTVKSSVSQNYKMDVKLFGFIPFKTVDLQVVPQQTLIPAGVPIGIYIRTDGVMVIGQGEFEGENHAVKAPAKHILQEGDYILKVNGEAVEKKAQLLDLIAESEGKELVLTIRREEETFDVKVTPEKNADGEYKLGIWIRDNAQGVGTMTFLTEDFCFGALGHGINDTDTAELMELKSGSLYKTKIVSVKKGEGGSPGELTGVIDYNPDNKIGVISNNSVEGIFGSLSEEIASEITTEAMPIGYKQDVELGKAQILCCVDGSTVPAYYDVEITGIRLEHDNVNRGLELKVTDAELLLQTGGIVQGMSGSPIIQNGKLVGAVTHVLVNDPTKGYGIFIENMLDAAG